MKIQYISDCHLEFYGDDIDVENFVTPCAPYLAIIGDLGYPGEKNFYNFLLQCSKLYEKVFYVSGNHEYYTCKNMDLPTMDELETTIDNICKSIPNVYRLNNSEYSLSDDVVIFGMTLWSYISESKKSIVKNSISDYKYIFCRESHYKTNITTTMTTKLHNESLVWLDEKLQANQNKQVIILTHHLPSFKMIDAKYKNSPANDAFASDLDYIMEENDNIKYWLCGHTHSSVTVKINNCECLTNPCGYNGENVEYSKEKYICL